MDKRKDDSRTIKEKLIQKFIGENKIQPLRIEDLPDGTSNLIYNDEKLKVQTINCESREILEEILVEFGGDNPETCKTEERFLVMDGTWGSEDLLKLGHLITKIEISGTKTVKDEESEIMLPPNCGEPALPGSKKGKEDMLLKRMVQKENLSRTMSFQYIEEFDNFIKFLLADKRTKELTYHVGLLATESKESGGQCVWRRIKAGDGTKRMVLELVSLNGKSYTDCVRQQLFDAAGDMFVAPCKRIEVKKKKESFDSICAFALEDGKIDAGKYEA